MIKKSFSQTFLVVVRIGATVVVVVVVVASVVVVDGATVVVVVVVGVSLAITFTVILKI